jgi:hypothetical protein
VNTNNQIENLRASVYRDFLNLCQLNEHHKVSLLSRKFSEKQLEHFQYRSVPDEQFLKKNCEGLYQIYGEKLFSVPGFIRTPYGTPSFINTPGQLIPMRAMDGKIWSLMRRNEEGEENKYVHISSQAFDSNVQLNCKPHWSHGNLPEKTVWLTEGPFKADRIAAFFRQRALAIPGVGMWKKFIPELSIIAPEEVILANDRDMIDNEHVARPTINLFRWLLQNEYKAKIAIWKNVKGVDDAINAFEKITFLEGEDAKIYLEKLAIKHQLGIVDWSETETISNSDDSIIFAELRELPDTKMEAQSLELNLLPASLQNVVHDNAHRMQVPIEFLAGPLVVFLSVLIGRKIRVQPFKLNPWTVICNLWGAIVAIPGALKTPSLNVIKKPFDKLEERFEAEYQEEKIKAQANLAILEIKKKVIEKNLESACKSNKPKDKQCIEGFRVELELIVAEIELATPKPKRYLVNDSTVEKLQAILMDNLNGILLIRDELMGFFKDLEKPGREGTRAFFLEGWDGSSAFKIDRIGRGTIYVAAVCLSVFGTIQPDVLQAYLIQSLKQGAGDDGLIQRFQIMFWPELKKDWVLVDEEPDYVALENFNQLVEKISAYQPVGEFDLINFSEESQVLFNSFITNLEMRLRSSTIASNVFQGHLAKYRSLLPSLCLIFHVVEEFSASDKIVNFEISTTTFNLALGWVKCLESHVEKVFFKAINEQLHQAHLLQKKILEGELKTGDSLRDVYRKQWSNLTNKNEVYEALQILIQYGWIAFERIESSNGKGKSIIKVNPEIFDGFLEND